MLVFLELISETAGVIVWLILCAFGFGEVTILSAPTDESKRLMSYFGWFMIGSMSGLVSYLVRPAGLIVPNPAPGLSVVVVPILAGGAMGWWGSRRKREGKDARTLASFWGGWLFTLGITVVRFVLVTFRNA